VARDYGGKRVVTRFRLEFRGFLAEMCATMRLQLIPNRGLIASLLAFLCLTMSCRAATAVLDLSGKEIVLGRQFHAASTGAKLPASRVYDYLLEGTVHGTGDLAPFVPVGTSISELMETFGGVVQPSGRVDNPSGRLPFNVVNGNFTRTIDIPSPLGGTIPVATTLKVNGGILATGNVQFSFLLNAKPILSGLPGVIGELVTPKGTIVFESGSNLAIQSFFDPFAGDFVGLVESTPFVHGRQGIAKLNVTLGGLMTGALQFQGASYRIKTGFDANLMTQDIPLGKTGFTGRFIADASNPDEILLEVRRTGVVAATSKLQRAPFVAGPPTIRGGAYTIALVPPPLEAGQTPSTHPVGDGFLTATVTIAGNVLFTGQLCDGKAIACASAMLADETIPFYAGGSTAQGGLFGILALHGESDPDDVDGTLRWIKSATPAQRIYKDAFDVNLTARGSRYLAPLPGQRVLGLTAGNFVLTGGNLNVPPTIPFLLSQRNVFTSPTYTGLKMATVTSKGLQHGTFKPSTKPAVALRGVVLQKQNSGSGFFIGNPGTTGAPESGRFEITPRIPAVP
jgi:hypothetical protein